MDISKEQKNKLLKKARRGDLTGFQAGWLEVAHFLQLERGEEPLFTDKQLKTLREPFRFSMRADTLDMDRICAVTRNLSLTKNELIAFYMAIQKNLNSACITILTKLHNKKSKEQIQVELLQGEELRKKIQDVTNNDLDSCLAYEAILEKLEHVLQLQIPKLEALREEVEKALERYNTLLSIVKDRPGFKRDFGKLPALSIESRLIDREIYLILKDRFFFDKSTSIVDLPKFDFLEMLNG